MSNAPPKRAEFGIGRPAHDGSLATCRALNAISSDFRRDFAQYCERCQGRGPQCLAALVQELATTTDRE